MSDLNEINRSLGTLEAKVETLVGAVDKLAGAVEGIQKTKWTTKGVLAGLAVGGGAVGGKLAALLGMTPPSQ